MASDSQALEPVIPESEDREETHTDWEKLLVLLNPAVVDAPPDRSAWKKLDYETVFWLINTAAETPWLDHLALAGIIHADSGAAHRGPRTPHYAGDL